MYSNQKWAGTLLLSAASVLSFFHPESAFASGDPIKKARHLAEQNATAALKSVKSQTFVQGQWVDATEMVYFYENGRVAIEENRTRDMATNQWQVTGKTSYKSSGSADTVTSFMKLGDVLQFDERSITHYTYDFPSGERRLSHTLYQEWSDNAWVNTSIDSVFWINGQIRQGVSYFWNDSWRQESYFRINQEGNDVESIDYAWNGMAWVETEKVLYKNTTIDAIYALISSFEESTIYWGLADFLSRFPDHDVYEYNDGVPTLVRKHRVVNYYFVAGSGYLSEKRITSEELVDGEWESSGIYGVKFDESGKITGTYSQAGPAFGFKEDYSYNAQNRLESVEVSFSGMNGMQVVSRFLMNWEEITSNDRENAQPHSFALGNAYPNPFNPSTVIPYEVSAAGDMNLSVYDATGRLVSTLFSGRQNAGQHSVRFDGRGLANGVYVVRLQSGSAVQSKKLTLLK